MQSRQSPFACFLTPITYEDIFASIFVCFLAVSETFSPRFGTFPIVSKQFLKYFVLFFGFVVAVIIEFAVVVFVVTVVDKNPKSVFGFINGLSWFVCNFFRSLCSNVYNLPKRVSDDSCCLICFEA